MIDLRSDTVTRPTPAMRRAMADAEVGDDVYGEDPTINRLEQRAAEILGKEAAVFVPTGTMGNTIAVKINTEHGQEIICESHAHLMDYELMGGDARVAIAAETGKRGMTTFLPPVVPFGSKQWPTLVTPGPGPASIADLR